MGSRDGGAAKARGGVSHAAPLQHARCDCDQRRPVLAHPARTELLCPSRAALFSRGERKPFHLDRYLDEQIFRFNNRVTKDKPMTDADRFSFALHASR